VKGERDGPGMYYHADGRVDVMQFKAGKPINSGVRLSSDRQHAWRLQGFNRASSKSLIEAAGFIWRVRAGHLWKGHRPKGSSGRLRLLLWLSRGSWRSRTRVAPDGASAAVHVESVGAPSERPLEQLLASPAPAPVSPHRGPLELSVD